jgi:thiamine pyrophosphate-dependent acetolactate synthase large subunit-like protein
MATPSGDRIDAAAKRLVNAKSPLLLLPGGECRLQSAHELCVANAGTKNCATASSSTQRKIKLFSSSAR